MPKYIFSKGKIRVEDGVYNPLLDDKRCDGPTGVILITKRPNTKPGKKEKHHDQA